MAVKTQTVVQTAASSQTPLIAKQKRCPTCGETITRQDQKVKPFCSPRCKDVDLGKWFLESYAVPEVEIHQSSDDHLV